MSDFYHPLSTSFHTSSPASSPVRNKREFEDDCPEPRFKRIQSHQLHSEIHISTVQMMMEASKLHRHESSPCDSQEIEENTAPQEPFQKPFWPQITRVRPRCNES